MTNDKLKIEADIDIIESYIRGLLTKFSTSKWKDDNTLLFLKEKAEIGNIVLDDKTMEATGTEVIKELKVLVKKKEEAEAKKITEEKAQASVFKNAMSVKSNFNGLIDNPDLFNKLSKDLTKIGIKEVKVKSRIGKPDSVQDDLVMYIDASFDDNIYDVKSGMYSRLRTSLFEKVECDASSSDNIRISENGFIKPYKGEKVTEIKLKGTHVGNYYQERNIIHSDDSRDTGVGDTWRHGKRAGNCIFGDGLCNILAKEGRVLQYSGRNSAFPS